MNEVLKQADDAEQLALRLLSFAARAREGAEEQGDLTISDYTLAPDRSANPDHQSMVGLVRWIYRARRRRESYFPADIFGEPSWDMLLDLYAASADGRDIGVNSLCLASNVPVTTALRWVGILEDRGLVERHRAAHDARLHYVRLSKAAFRDMRKYLIEIDHPHTRTGTVFMFADE